jgi:hypothetical protein
MRSHSCRPSHGSSTAPLAGAGLCAWEGGCQLSSTLRPWVWGRLHRPTCIVTALESKRDQHGRVVPAYSYLSLLTEPSSVLMLDFDCVALHSNHVLLPNTAHLVKGIASSVMEAKMWKKRCAWFRSVTVTHFAFAANLTRTAIMFCRLLLL